MRHGNRLPRTDVKALHTATRQIYLNENQRIYETKKAWEIWQEGEGVMFRRIKRFTKTQILFTLMGDDAWHSA